MWKAPSHVQWYPNPPLLVFSLNFSLSFRAQRTHEPESARNKKFWPKNVKTRQKKKISIKNNNFLVISQVLFRRCQKYYKWATCFTLVVRTGVLTAGKSYEETSFYDEEKRRSIHMLGTTRHLRRLWNIHDFFPKSNLRICLERITICQIPHIKPILK